LNVFCRCLGIHTTHDAPYGQCENITPSTKPEVHDIATLPQEDRARATSNMHKNLVKFGSVVFQLYERADRQTDRQTQTEQQTFLSQYFAPLPGKLIMQI